MAASGNLSTSESALSRKKQEILARSMAIFDQQVTQWLDITLSEPMKRAGKRARDDHDSGVEDGSTSTSPRHDVRNTKKRAKREPQAATVGRRFACPFHSNNPAKYKAVKTCCGPGWTDIHRVKEHIYRRHCLKHACPRCFEQFGNVEELKQHQRLDDPCKVRKNTVDDVITDDQEKQIRARAKTNQPEKDRWKDLYRIIFPGTKKIPSPYYETTLPKEEEQEQEEQPTTPSTSTSTGIHPNQFIHFKNEAEVLECRAHIHRGLRRAVRPVLEQEVDKLFRSVQHAMTQRVTEICKDVVTKIVRTWQFGSQQAGSSPSSPSPSASPSPSTIYEEEEEEAEEVKMSTVPISIPGPVEVSYEQFIADTPNMMDSFLLENGVIDLEAILASGGLDSAECGESFGENTAVDSAYFSHSVSAESGAGVVVEREWFGYEV